MVAMNRPLHVWLAFGLSLAIVLAAMGWVSLTALRLDQAGAAARRQAALEENVRLALWRMDSGLAPIIACENARPYFQYSAFCPTERAYTRMFAEIRRGEILVPSPLLKQTSPYILLHFQFAPGGTLTSPQVPLGNMRDLAETGYATHEEITASEDRLNALRALVNRDRLVALVPWDTAQQTAAVRAPQAVRFPTSGSHKVHAQGQRSAIEWQKRAQAYQQTTVEQKATTNIALAPSDVREGPMRPVWVAEALLLARRVSIHGQEYVQGCRLHWPRMKSWLLSSVKDLLPQADLKPLRVGAGDVPAEQASTRMLAALPVRLTGAASSSGTDDVPVPLGTWRGNGTGPMRALSPIRLSLLIAWACVLLAAGAAAALLVGAVSLSERRGAFVSAVTHELRTPLTTFRMYTEMLAEKMVPEEKRQRYLHTLRAEADRLGHLVENVLAYARLEGRRGSVHAETVSLGDLLDRVRPRLAERARVTGMDLVVECSEGMGSQGVRTDPSAVEQILFNLVDNACKYATRAADRRIHLAAARQGRRVALRVRDHGPGVTSREARRLFRPFCKSALDAADSAPGVGLGLALSRRLARTMGGDLRLDEDVDDGACFILLVPEA